MTNAMKSIGRNEMAAHPYTTSDAFLEALQEQGVQYIFANLGSDHPAIIESLTRRELNGIASPQLVISQHEMVAMSAAHGYAQVTGKPQAVMVHVDVGTQNLGGAVHNAAKARIPVFIFAGTSPATMEGELMGTRNEYIHWLQDVYDQRGIVREYMKYANEIRTGHNVKQLVYRSLQLANSDPKGPVYLIAAREVLEEEIKPCELDISGWGPISVSALPMQDIRNIAEQLMQAQYPLIVTSYVGRSKQAVEELIRLADRLAIPVIESVPYYMNFPYDHPMHSGYMWNEQSQNEHIAKADFILVLDSDVPWIPSINRPSPGCKVVYVDVDPLKEKTPLWYIPSEKFYRASSAVVLQQLNEYLDGVQLEQMDRIQQRYAEVSEAHRRQRQEWRGLEKPDGDRITPEYLTACVGQVVGEEAIVLSETITNFSTVNKHLPRNKSGTYYSLGAGALGWNGGAAIGVKLASPDKLVVNLTGDGCYIFSQPTSVHWMSRKYNAPFLTVIYNNEQWAAPRFSTLSVHPDGYASKSGRFWTTFEPSSDLAKVAEAAGGAYASTVTSAGQLMEELRKAVEEVKNGRSAVVDVRITAN
jgi:acetolactate synthase-1/2/3 large subunit